MEKERNAKNAMNPTEFYREYFDHCTKMHGPHYGCDAPELEKLILRLPLHISLEHREALAVLMDALEFVESTSHHVDSMEGDFEEFAYQTINAVRAQLNDASFMLTATEARGLAHAYTRFFDDVDVEYLEEENPKLLKKLMKQKKVLTALAPTLANFADAHPGQSLDNWFC